MAHREEPEDLYKDHRQAGSAEDGAGDNIVCWSHNWPECPLPVIELKELVNRLG